MKPAWPSSIPAKQPVMKPAWRSAGDPSRLNRVAARRSSLRFGRNTLGIPPSRALSAGPPPGELGLAGLGAHAGSTTGCSPRRFASLIVAFRSQYTRYSSLTRLVSRAPRPHREDWPTSALTWVPPPAVHRVATRRSSLRFGRNTPGPVLWGLLPHAPCQPGASPPPGGLAGLGAHADSTTGCSPRRCAALIVAFRSQYTRASSPGGGSSLARLVSRAPRPHRENWASPLSALAPLYPQAASAAS